MKSLARPAWRNLPKVELHRHLEGSVRFETLVDLARERNLGLSRAELRRRGTMRGCKPDFLGFLSKFSLYRGLYPSREWIERVAFEAAEDAVRDGIVHLELRFSAAHFARGVKARGEDVAAWIVHAVRRAAPATRFIATFSRDFTVKENAPNSRAVEGTDFFSGLDVAGNEAKSALPFLPFFRRSGLPATIHAGEAGGADNVRQAIEKFGARRIGHGVRVLEDPEVVALARRKGVVFETCLTSEILTGAARSWERHPARRMIDASLRTTLSTDDPAVCGVTLSGEFAAARRAGLTREDLRAATIEAARAAFMPAAARTRLVRRIEAAWGTIRS